MDGHERIFLLAFAMAALDAICQGVIPLFFRAILNALQADPGQFMATGIWQAMGWAVGLAAIFFPAAYLFHVFLSVGAARLSRNLQNNLHDHVQRLSADFFQRHKVGEISARLNADLETINASFGPLSFVVWAAFGLFFGLVAAYWVDWPLAVLMTLFLILIAWVTSRHLPAVRDMSRDVRDAAGEVTAMVTEYVGIHELIKSYSREDLAGARVRAGSNRVRKRRERLAWRMFAVNDSIQLVTRFVAPFILLFYGAWRVLQGQMMVGDIVAFWGIWMIIGSQMAAAYGSISQIYAAIASFDRIDEFLLETPMVRNEPDARSLSRVQGRITFDDVVFSYPSVPDSTVLRGITFTVEPGRRVALVGPSGAGKSTIIQMVLRFYDPDSGVVRLDGQDLRVVRQDSLRQQIGVVMQESILFSGSIQENLRLAAPNASEEELKTALEAAGAWDFVSNMDQGLNSVVGERGTRLSGGQKQRLSIARVFLKDPPVLLLDEATSSLDSLSEKLVQAAMTRLMAGRTSLVVAHRLATVKDADEILVLRAGQIAARGSHDELLLTSPDYYELCAHQGLT